MIVYRIVKSKRASGISGTGAALYPGRWNIKGTPVLYTSATKAVALLEIIVHTPQMLVPRLDILTIEIPDDSIEQLEIADLPKNWSQFPAPTILSEIGQTWVEQGASIALMVPSCIIHTSYNLILNCSHTEYSHKVRIVDQRSFHFDSRLRK